MIQIDSGSAMARTVELHDLANEGVVHTNLVVADCVCSGSVAYRKPNFTGEVCVNCGGMAVRTGTCTTCTECGTTGGCG